MKKIKVLIIDDHPFVADAVEIFFQNAEKEINDFQFEVHKAENCEHGYHLIMDSNRVQSAPHNSRIIQFHWHEPLVWKAVQLLNLLICNAHAYKTFILSLNLH